MTTVAVHHLHKAYSGKPAVRDLSFSVAPGFAFSQPSIAPGGGPFLPGIGALFRHTQQGAVKSELVILLRPTVVDTPDTWKRSLSESGDRVRGLDQGFHFGGRPDVFGNLGEKRL